MAVYSYTKTPVSISRLKKEIQDSAIVTALDYMNLFGAALDVYFKADLSGGDIVVLNGLVDAHTGKPLIEEVPQPVQVANIPVVITQYELNDKDLKLARAKAEVDAVTRKALLSIQVPGAFGSQDGRYIAGGYAITEDYDKDDYAKVWVSDDDRKIAMMVALAMNPLATEPVSDETIKAMGPIPGMGISLPNYPAMKSYADDDMEENNQGWYFWPTAQGNNLPAVGETEVEPIAGYGFIPGGLYLKISYTRPLGKTTGSIRINLFWGKKG